MIGVQFREGDAIIALITHSGLSLNQASGLIQAQKEGIRLGVDDVISLSRVGIRTLPYRAYLNE
jgi:hypothetical protein